MSDIIKVKLKNYTTMNISCNDGIAMELSEEFSFFAKDYKFMPLYINKIWDGKVRIFNYNAREFPVGLYSHLVKFCKTRNYKIDFIDSEYGIPGVQNDIDPKDIMDFIKGLKLHSDGKPIEVRDYQFNAVCTTLMDQRILLLSPTGSGKSLIIYILMRYLLQHINTKVLLIVPTTSLVEQMYTDFEDYSSHDDSWNVDQECHKIYQGKEKFGDLNQVFISTWQSIYKLPLPWFKQFEVIFGDEVHLFTADSLTGIIKKNHNSKWRIGTTGTLDGSLVHELVLQGHFGKIMDVTTTKKLQDAGVLAQLDINMINTIYPEEIRRTFGKIDYQDEVNYIVGYQPRNDFITKLSNKLEGNTLVLYLLVDKHGKKLYKQIKDMVSEDRKVFFVSGAVSATEREAIRKIVETQKDAIIVASYKTFSTGINIKNLHNIIFASPSKSQIRVLQSIGRGLRMSENGKATRLFDICDNISWKRRRNHTLKHADDRLNIYKKQKFKVKHIKVKLE